MRQKNIRPQVPPGKIFSFVLVSLVSMVLLPHWLVATATAQRQLSVTREIQLQGSFKLLVGDEMTVTDVDGKQHQLRIQADPNKPIGLSGGDIALSQPAEIEVLGVVSNDVLRTGMVLDVKCKLAAGGTVGPIESVQLLPIGTEPVGVSVETMPTGREQVDASVQGFIKSVDSKRVVVSVPRHDLVTNRTVIFDRENVTDIQTVTASLSMLKTGDVIGQLDAAELSTGDSVVRRIRVEMVGERADLRLTIDEQLQLKHYKLSDLPGEPREFRSQHYFLQTDISDRQASVLLDKLESMFALVADHYDKQPGEILEVYVVQDIKKWDTSQWEPRVTKLLRQGQGTTVYARKGGKQVAAVISSDNQDVVKHEAVHGFCFLAFQGTGPLWYAEGVAEMGQYWQPGDPSVNADPAVIGYLRSRPPHPLKSIINATKIEGEFWKAYAWRWALCHFLAINPNYANDFQRLGPGLMRKRRGVSFENTWRRQANELTFEYHQFLKHLETGLRADLIAWQWDVEHAVPNTGRALQMKIQAAGGWQATGALLEQGMTYETRAKGNWKLSPNGEDLDADGDDDGQGQLIGVIMNENYELSDEFDLGTDPDFTAIADGQLYVRCQERMSLIGDNLGEVNFAIRKKK